MADASLVKARRPYMTGPVGKRVCLESLKIALYLYKTAASKNLLAVFDVKNAALRSVPKIPFVKNTKSHTD